MFENGEPGWLERLQEGEHLLVQYRAGSLRQETVKRITPTQIRLSSDVVIDRQTGRQRGSVEDAKFYPASPNNMRRAELLRARTLLHWVDWAEVSDGDVLKIFETVKHAIHRG